MTGYVISRDRADATTEFVATVGAYPITVASLADAKAFADRRAAVRLLHREGLHLVGWRVENARRYREAVQS